MSLEDQTTRRTIVATGAKIAYAAPIVAASFKLSAHSAGAQRVSDPTGGNCSGDFSCGVTAAVPCGENEFGTCYCFANTERQGICGSNEVCANLQQNCVTTADCPANHRCAVNTCCVVNVCIEDCAQTQGAGFKAQEAGGLTPSGQ